MTFVKGSYEFCWLGKDSEWNCEFVTQFYGYFVTRSDIFFIVLNSPPLEEWNMDDDILMTTMMMMIYLFNGNLIADN